MEQLHIDLFYLLLSYCTDLSTLVNLSMVSISFQRRVNSFLSSMGTDHLVDSGEPITADWLCGRIIGRGGFSKVFELGGISHLCVKVVWDGPSVKEGVTSDSEVGTNKIIELDASKNQTEIFDWGIYFLSSQSWVVSFVSSRHLNRITKSEYDYLKYNTLPLYPKVYTCGYKNHRFYYVMERIPGVTLRKLLLSHKSIWNIKNNIELIPVDIKPAIIRIITELRDTQMYHGDLKPENMICQFHNKELQIRLIDPVAHLHKQQIGSAEYNPFGLWYELADVCAIIIILLEIFIGRIVFSQGITGSHSIHYVSQELEEIKRRSPQESLRFLLVQQLQEIQYNYKAYSPLLELLSKYQKKIIVQVPSTLLTN